MAKTIYAVYTTAGDHKDYFVQAFGHLENAQKALTKDYQSAKRAFPMMPADWHCMKPDTVYVDGDDDSHTYQLIILDSGDRSIREADYADMHGDGPDIPLASRIDSIIINDL